MKKKEILFYTLMAMAVVIFATTTVFANESLPFSEKFYLNFVKDNRWEYLSRGLLRTLQISFFAVIIGIIGGFIIAILRSTFDTIEKKNVITKCINWILKAYITVIRGTPAVIQLMIIYYVT